jgi:hypothetical protein
MIGLSKGLVADDKINQAEAEILQSWLIQNSQASDNLIMLRCEINAQQNGKEVEVYPSNT